MERLCWWYGLWIHSKQGRDGTSFLRSSEMQHLVVVCCCLSKTRNSSAFAAIVLLYRSWMKPHCLLQECILKPGFFQWRVSFCILFNQQEVGPTRYKEEAKERAKGRRWVLNLFWSSCNVAASFHQVHSPTPCFMIAGLSWEGFSSSCLQHVEGLLSLCFIIAPGTKGMMDCTHVRRDLHWFSGKTSYVVATLFPSLLVLSSILVARKECVVRQRKEHLLLVSSSSSLLYS